MLRLLIDHDFNDKILQGLHRAVSKLDAVAARAIGFQQASDTAVLERAAAEGRIVLSHDVQTMPGFAITRVRRGDPMPGLVVVPQQLPIGQAVRELTMLVSCSDQVEWQNLIVYLPL